MIRRMSSEETQMEEQRERTSRRRPRRKSKAPRSKGVFEPVLIAARRPDSPLLKNGFHNVVASAQPKHAGQTPRGAASYVVGRAVEEVGDQGMQGAPAEPGLAAASYLGSVSNGSGTNGAPHVAVESADAGEQPREGVRRRAVRIVKVAPPVLTPGNREQQLIDRLVRSQGRGAISRAADDLWESKFVAPKRQEIQIQLLEHENEHRARDAVFAMAELLQREAPIKRPVLDQRLRRLEQFAEDPITRDAAGALRRSMRVHHGGL